MWLCNRPIRAANPKAPLWTDETVSCVREITFCCFRVSAWCQLVSNYPRIAMNYRVTGSVCVLTTPPLTNCFTGRVARVGLWMKLLLSRVDTSRPTTTLLSPPISFVMFHSVTCLTCLPHIVTNTQLGDEITSISENWLIGFFLLKLSVCVFNCMIFTGSLSDVGSVVTGRR